MEYITVTYKKDVLNRPFHLSYNTKLYRPDGTFSIAQDLPPPPPQSYVVYSTRTLEPLAVITYIYPDDTRIPHIRGKVYKERYDSFQREKIEKAKKAKEKAELEKLQKQREQQRSRNPYIEDPPWYDTWKNPLYWIVAIPFIFMGCCVIVLAGCMYKLAYDVWLNPKTIFGYRDIGFFDGVGFIISIMFLTSCFIGIIKAIIGKK